MTIKEQLLQLIKNWRNTYDGIYGYDEETDDEVSIEDSIKDFLKKYFDKSQYTYDITTVFESPGIGVYSLSIAWIEDGKIQTILNEIIENC